MKEQKNTILHFNKLQTLGREPWILKFNDLMNYRIREILLVSSQYDAFILEEDGPLNERLLAEYSVLNLSFCPRIIHASNIEEALDLINKRNFDLIINVPRMHDVEINSFAKIAKKKIPNIPVVLLFFDEASANNFCLDIDHSIIDQVLLWNGDARILFAIIKLVEDSRNVEHDTRVGGVQVIIVVEDSLRNYSNFLAILYTEVMKQSSAVIADVLSDLHKLTRMRSRPKILLATSYEEAVNYFNKFPDNILAIISDIRFPKEGELSAHAGFELVEYIQKKDPHIPILLQSTEIENKQKAKKLKIKFANKKSPNLPKSIISFLKEDLGFGDFIFRLPNSTEIESVSNLYEMERALKKIPPDSLRYHAKRNDFSMWLKARSMFILASLLRSKSVDNFSNIEEFRKYLQEVLSRARQQEQGSVIADFSLVHQQYASENMVVRLGSGSLGGKGRGIAFINSLLMRENIIEDINGLNIRTPRTLVISTDEFNRFLEENFPSGLPFRNLDDQKIKEYFLNSKLPKNILRDLKVTWNELKGPLAIRSSSLLEDSQSIPLAGIYATYMLPNNHPNSSIRFKELQNAVKCIYASTFCKNAQTFMAATNNSIEDEKMAIVIQEIVGQRYKNRLYPLISGVAMSHNYYPIGNQKAEEGVTQIALGLGHTVVQGGTALRFSPSSPQNLPQFTNAKDYVKKTQTKFYAINLSKYLIDFLSPQESSLKTYNLEDAEDDGTLQQIGSVYSIEDDQIRENFRTIGPRAITFNNILKWNSIPLASALELLLKVIRNAMGSDFEIEFAVDISPNEAPCLYILQIRPFLKKHLALNKINKKDFNKEQILCSCKNFLGHGIINNIYDIIYVKYDSLEKNNNKKIAFKIGEISEKLRIEKRPFFLIGPGRWGSSDPRLGIPVEWFQIAGVNLIAEVHSHDKNVDPSQGTHFFQNITSLGIGYLTLMKEELDINRINNTPALWENDFIKHLQFQNPLTVYLDGKNSSAIVVT